MLRARAARTGPDIGTTGQKFKWLYSDDNSGNSLAMLMPEKLIKKTGKEQKKVHFVGIYKERPLLNTE